jgi:hypothetical protein
MNRDRSLSRENTVSVRNNFASTPNLNSNKSKTGKFDFNKSTMNTQRSNINTNPNIAQDIGRITFADSVLPNAKF